MSPTTKIVYLSTVYKGRDAFLFSKKYVGKFQMYQIVYHNTLSGLQEKVAEQLEKKVYTEVEIWKWKVHGDLMFHADGFIQVLIKEGYSSSCTAGLERELGRVEDKLDDIHRTLSEYPHPI